MRNYKKSKGLVKSKKIKNRIFKHRKTKSRKTKSRKTKSRKTKIRKHKKTKKHKGGMYKQPQPQPQPPMTIEENQNIWKQRQLELDRKKESDEHELKLNFNDGTYNLDNSVKFLQVSRAAVYSRDPDEKDRLWNTVRMMYEDKTQPKNIYIDYANKRETITPLIYAIMDNNLNVVRFLLENRANVNHETFREETPLTYATHKKDVDNVDMIELLLDNNAMINHSLEQSTGYTPLMYIINGSSYYKDLSTKKTRLLLRYNPDLTIEDSHGVNALYHAIRVVNLDIVEMLLDKLKSTDFQNYINFKNIRGHYALTYAMYMYISYKEQHEKDELIKIINRLLDFEGIKVDIRMPMGTDFNGRKILYTAEQLGLDKIAERLKALGAK